jgi:nitrogen fixation NifU-like protein
MYNPTIVKHFSEPFFVGELSNPTHIIEVGNPVCGDRIRVRLYINQGRVEQVRYHAWGCATSLATGDIFCEAVQGKTLQDIEYLNLEQRADLLGELEPSQYHCVDILHALYERLLQLDFMQNQGVA